MFVNTTYARIKFFPFYVNILKVKVYVYYVIKNTLRYIHAWRVDYWLNAFLCECYRTCNTYRSPFRSKCIRSGHFVSFSVAKKNRSFDFLINIQWKTQKWKKFNITSLRLTSHIVRRTYGRTQHQRIKGSRMIETACLTALFSVRWFCAILHLRAHVNPICVRPSSTVVTVEDASETSH